MNSYLAIKTSHQLASRELAELRKIWTHATNTEANAIGWLPTRAFDVRSENNHVAAIYRNNDLVGWTMYEPSRARGVMKLYQIWVRPDARIIEHGRALVIRLKLICQIKHCYLIEAWVAEDLPANLFWRAIGFTRTNWRFGSDLKKRKLYRWIQQIYEPPTNLCENGGSCKILSER